MITISQEPVILLGAGPLSPQDIEEILPRAPRLVAADGGAASALRAGHVPEAVIGDLDSLPQFARDALPADSLQKIPEQDTTDFEKAIANIDAPLILALGFTGRRLDHELAVLNALVRYPERRIIVIGDHDIIFHAPETIALPLPEGTRCSLFPMGPVTGRSEGLRWPIDGIAFAPDGRIGTSNLAVDHVELAFDGPGMLINLPRGALHLAEAALLQS